MVQWLKALYKKTFKNQADEFFIFLEFIQYMKKDTIKKMMKWHEVNEQTLTINSAIEFVLRSLHPLICSLTILFL
ncbi:hypothetical protein [Peribacillus acanthi]|uniref:hypothetical protein n=1 Tax=Peribacillus acanthi TaxID=2171554 RepID=UPI000D3EC8D8|nr:hypothetical protein [Peribacillus acanthi]